MLAFARDASDDKRFKYTGELQMMTSGLNLHRLGF